MAWNNDRSARTTDPNQRVMSDRVERNIAELRKSNWKIPEGYEQYQLYAEVLRRVPHSRAKDKPDPIDHANEEEALLIFERLSMKYLKLIKARNISEAHTVEERILRVFDRLDDLFGIERICADEINDHILEHGHPPNWAELI